MPNEFIIYLNHRALKYLKILSIPNSQIIYKTSFYGKYIVDKTNVVTYALS
jgi:hypothetical protein